MKIYNDDNRLKISFKLNNELIQKQVKPRQLLSDFLRFEDFLEVHFWAIFALLMSPTTP